jgi:hypothetical protein
MSLIGKFLGHYQITSQLSKGSNGGAIRALAIDPQKTATISRSAIVPMILSLGGVYATIF